MQITLRQNSTVARHLWFHYRHQLPGSVLRRDKFVHEAIEASDPHVTNHVGIPSFPRRTNDRPEEM